MKALRLIAMNLLLVFYASLSYAEQYTLVKIADSTCTEFFCDTSTFFTSPAVMNDAGAIAFSVHSEGNINGPVDHIVLAHGRTFIGIASSKNPLFQVGGLRDKYSLNNAGSVVFEAVLGGPTSSAVGLFIGNGNSLKKVAESCCAGFLGSEPSINNSGSVAYSVGTAIQLVRGTNTGVMIDDSGPFEFFAPPIFNDTGAVVFRGNLDDSRVGIFVADGKKTVSIAVFDDTFRYAGGNSSYSINNSGRVIFIASSGELGGVYVGDGSSLKQIADTSGAYSLFPVGTFHNISPAINNQGKVAFRAQLRDGRSGIFSGPDSVNDKVISTGDTLFGSNVVSIQFNRYGLNDEGQIAFNALLADGTQGIYLAIPNKK
jgi:hypothetical protein